MAGKTKADAQGEWYKLEANKQTLLTLLRLRFPPLPPEIEQRIVRTLEARQVKTWLCRFAHGDDLDSLGILSTTERDKVLLDL